MKYFILTAFVVLFAVPAHASSLQADAKRELQDWSVAAVKYEQDCKAGKLRQQMPQNKAVGAYECFAEIINKNVDLQYPDLYAKLDKAMMEAHSDYGSGKANWDATLDKLREASDDYNAAVARRNKSTGND